MARVHLIPDRVVFQLGHLRPPLLVESVMVGFCHFVAMFFVGRVTVGATLFERRALFCGFRVSSFSIVLRIIASEADHFHSPLVWLCAHLAKVRFN